jgi:drug/metabolite transporter (DMT)-like permease
MSEKASSAASSLFDLRTVIAILFAFYGVVLTVMGFVTATPENTAKSGGLNLNLWTGIGMLILAAIFVVWARAKPLGAAAPPPAADDDRPPMHH